MKFPEGKIGEMAAKPANLSNQQVEQLGAKPAVPVAKSADEVARVATQTAAYAEKHWPRTPVQTPPPSLPPKIQSRRRFVRT